LEPLWLDTKTGNELLADLSSFVSAQAGKDVKVSLLGTR
jgi:CyaY protein